MDKHFASISTGFIVGAICTLCVGYFTGFLTAIVVVMLIETRYMFNGKFDILLCCHSVAGVFLGTIIASAIMLSMRGREIEVLDLDVIVLPDPSDGILIQDTLFTEKEGTDATEDR